MGLYGKNAHFLYIFLSFELHRNLTSRPDTPTETKDKTLDQKGTPDDRKDKRHHEPTSERNVALDS